MQKSHKAFSLIELSIVILIIGILIAGVTQSSRLVKQFRIRTGQTLTQSSPVNSIKDLALWYEPTLDDSFLSYESEDGRPISVWHDISSQSTSKNDASQATVGSQPLYTSDSINGLPAVRFDGTDDFLSFNGDFLIGNSYSIFIVEEVRAYQDASPFIGGVDNVTDGNLVIGLDNMDGGNMLISQIGSGALLPAIGLFTTPTPHFHTLISSSPIGDDPGTGKAYWLNGGVDPDASDTSMTSSLVSFNGSTVGQLLAAYYLNGDISEIIIFTRALKTEERQSVEGYLSKKYNLKIIEEIFPPITP